PVRPRGGPAPEGTSPPCPATTPPRNHTAVAGHPPSSGRGLAGTPSRLTRLGPHTRPPRPTPAPPHRPLALAIGSRRSAHPAIPSRKLPPEQFYQPYDHCMQ